MKRMRRAFSLILCMAMVVSMVPSSTVAKAAVQQTGEAWNTLSGQGLSGTLPGASGYACGKC